MTNPEPHATGSAKPRVLLLALGNDLIGDDAIALHVVRTLRPEFEGRIDIMEASIAGLRLLDLIEDYTDVLLIDTMMSGLYPIGTICEFTPSDFSQLMASSPHSIGLPEIILLANQLNHPFPNQFRVVTVEIVPDAEMKIGLSIQAHHILPTFTDRVRATITTMLHDLDHKLA